LKIRLKLFANLGTFLPADAVHNQIELDVPEDTTPAHLIQQFNIPLRLAHLVLVNGVYLYPEQRGQQQLVEGDVLAIWPPIAGG
jgi:sulfur carrier protein ThiS